MGELDGVEESVGRRYRRLPDAGPLLLNPQRLHGMARRDGFLFLAQLIPAERVAGLRRIVLEYAREVGWLAPESSLEEARAAKGRRIGDYDDPDWVQLQVRVQMRPELREVGESPEIRGAVQAARGLAGLAPLSTANTCRVFSPHLEIATQPHQDAHYVKAIHHLWTAWVPLGDCPLELGPLAVLSGSHESGLLPHAGEGGAAGALNVDPEAVWSTANFRAGDVLLFSGHTLHCSLPNRSGDRLRCSADFRYGFDAS